MKRNAFLLIAASLVMTSCYGPAYMTNTRSPDNWGCARKVNRCDAYNGVQFDTVQPQDTIAP